MPDKPRTIVIVGGGPAGMVAGLLFARAGVPVTVLEKHGDFLRDFRGDTVHPATLDLFRQLGLLDGLLAIRHSVIDRLTVRIAGRRRRIVDLSSLGFATPYIAMMPQWDLLDFIADEARHYPDFSLRMNCAATGISTDSTGRVAGVTLADGEHLAADLVIAADGRRSVLRRAAGLPLETLGAPIDVFWFRLDRPADLGEEDLGIIAAGHFLVLIDRIDYFQCAYVYRKGDADRIRAHGLDAFKTGLVEIVPELAASIARIDSWDAVSTLEVALDRLIRWHRPGLLAIGDAAHAMSPVGGVGINYAVQDAVVAANLLAAPLSRGADPDPLLAEIQRRRAPPVARMQWLQRQVHDRVLAPLIARRAPLRRAPWPVRLLDASPALRRLAGRMFGLVLGGATIRSPDAGRRSAGDAG